MHVRIGLDFIKWILIDVKQTCLYFYTEHVLCHIMMGIPL